MPLTSHSRLSLRSILSVLLCGLWMFATTTLQAGTPTKTTKALKTELALKKPPTRRAKSAKSSKVTTHTKVVRRKQQQTRKKKKKQKHMFRQKTFQRLAVFAKREAPPGRPAARKAKSKKKAKPRGAQATRQLTQWLRLGPGPLPMPAFHNEKQGKYTYTQMLTQAHVQLAQWHPKAGESFDWPVGRALRWQPSTGRLRPRGAGPQVAYLATYIDTDRYTQLQLKLRSHQRLRVFLDGKVIATKSGCTPSPRRHRAKRPANRRRATPTPTRKTAPSTSSTQPSDKVVRPSQAAGPPAHKAIPLASPEVLREMMKLLAQQARVIETQANTIASQGARMRLVRKAPPHKRRVRKAPGLAQAKLALTPGVHLLIVKALHTPGCVRHWGVQGSLHHTKKSTIPRALEITRTPYRRHSLAFYFYRTHLGGLSISPDGKQVLVRKYKWTRQNRWAHWLEIRRTQDGKLLHSGRPHNRLLGVQWSPQGDHYSFVSSAAGGKKTLWVVNRKTGEIRALLRDIAHLGSHHWAPNGRLIVYHITQRATPSPNEKIGAKRLRGMDDRYPTYRHRSFLYAVSVKSGSSIRLTAGALSTGAPGIRFDSKRILFTRSRPKYNKRPFHRTDLYELDLTTLQAHKLLANLRWFNGASYAPDGKQILLLGGPSLFGHLGRSPRLPTNVTTNDYEGEAYIYDIQKRQYTAISRRFVPHIESAHWHNIDGKIYITALDKASYRLFQYDPKTAIFLHIPTDVDLTTQVQFAHNSSQIVYLGQGIRHPNRLYTLDLFQPQPRLLLAPNRNWLSQLTLARVAPFVTSSSRGYRIEGRVYYPPNFDPRRKYPAIVYYYGGTFPTPRYFDGAYSGQLWASHGYVTYILQPSGAIGYGQRFAARHVNEWGTIVPEEIIDATQDFLKAHPFVDPKRVGCTGASYGGFTTMSIVTKTNLFAAAISHAGISNITSYWGAGFWGYWYSAIAGAKRYPWTHPYFYVKQSPLFSADKVTTPLLLLHGDSDNNVPPSESYQMYAALRLLKKQVELVLFQREGHGVRDYKKRKIWVKTILAWFAKHLKGQPLWWQKMYGKRQH